MTDFPRMTLMQAALLEAAGKGAIAIEGSALTYCAGTSDSAHRYEFRYPRNAFKALVQVRAAARANIEPQSGA